MNKINNMSKLLCAVFFVAALVSCNNDDYTPGEQVVANSPEVYFLGTNTVNAELDGMAEGEKSVVLTLERKKTEGALTVPIGVTHTSKGLVVPSAVQFESGAATTEIKITCTNELEFNVKNVFDIYIADKKLTNPYSATNEGTVTFQGGVTVWGDWEFLAEADVVVTDYSTSSPPAFEPYKQKIYKRGRNQYYIEDFCLNGRGFNFNFTTNGIFIIPDKNSGYHDGTSRWYFYDSEATNDPAGAWDQNKYRIIGYLPNAQDEYLRYFYFYLSGSNYNFVFNEESKTATMTGFARYRAASAGRFTLKFSW